MSVYKRSAHSAVIVTTLLLLVGAARAQQPSQDQLNAIRQSCRSDFMAHCSGVTPGGKDALDCLKRNLAGLSGACKSAVSALTPPPSAAPAAAAPVPPSPPAAAVPSPATTPAAPPAAAAKPSTPKPAPSPSAKLTPAPAPAPPAAAPAPTVAPLTPRPFIMPERRLAIVGICRFDVAKLCAGTPPGGDRIIQCLAVNAGSLSPECYDAIARVSR